MTNKEQPSLAAAHLLTGIPQVGEIVTYEDRLYGEILTVDNVNETCEIAIHGRVGSNYPVRWGQVQRYCLWRWVEPMK